MDIEQELWARDQQNTPHEERAAHELKRQREEIGRLRGALHGIRLKTRGWSDMDEALDDIDEMARTALEGK